MTTEFEETNESSCREKCAFPSHLGAGTDGTFAHGCAELYLSEDARRPGLSTLRPTQQDLAAGAVAVDFQTVGLHRDQIGAERWRAA